MSALNGFLQAILDDPCDDTPRLIFADWLQDQPDPSLAARGELIHVQCRLASGRVPATERAALEEQQHRLLQLYRFDWLGQLHGFHVETLFDRGLVRAVFSAGVFVARMFASHLGEQLRRAWVESVWLKHPAGHIKGLARTAALADLAGLDLDGGGLTDTELDPLWGSRHTLRLRRLELANNALTDTSVASLLDSPLAGQLLWLELSNNALTDWGAKLLLSLTAGPEAALAGTGWQCSDSGHPGTAGELAEEQTADSTQVVARRFTNSIGMEFVLIPAGEEAD